MKEAKQKIDWEAFWALPMPTVSDEAVKEALDWVKATDQWTMPLGCERARSSLCEAADYSVAKALRTQYRWPLVVDARRDARCLCALGQDGQLSPTNTCKLRSG